MNDLHQNYINNCENEFGFWPKGLYADRDEAQPLHVVSDAGRSLSKRPKASNDCTVRAVAVAFNIPYDEAYEQLAAMGRKCGQGPDTADWKKWIGARSTWQAFQAVKGSPRMNAVRFCQQFPTGRYILSFAGHVAGVIDGHVYDVKGFDANRCVYGAYKI
jgi:hypothetical protein